MGFVLILSMSGVALSFLFLSFPSNFVFGGASLGATIAILYFHNRMEKKARLDVFYQAANTFGRPVSFENHSAAFERDGTNFDIECPKDKYNTAFHARFSIPKVEQSFVIQHNALFKKSIPGCVFVENSPLRGLIFLHASNPDFLLNLLKNKNILNEIYNYPEKVMSNFSIVFDEGSFEIEWTPPLGEQIDGLFQVCQTAAVFYDELKKHAKTS